MSDAAEFFEAISHPTRIKILRILEKNPSSFASLKRQLNIDSSGNLDHHLKKLSPLIKVQNDGLYGLTDAGKEALLSLGAVELSKKKERHPFHSLAEMPQSILILVLLEGIIGLLSFLTFLPLQGWVTINYYLLNIYVVSTILSVFSVVLLLKANEHAWTFVIVQSAILIAAGCVVLIGYGNFMVIYASSATFGALRTVLLLPAVASLILSLLPSVREVLGTRYVTRFPRRALVGSIIALGSVVFNFWVGGILVYGWGGGTGVLGLLLHVTAFAIVAGAVLVLARRFLSGGLVLIISSCISFYYYFLISAVILSAFGLSSEFAYLLGLLIFAMPLAAGILSLTSRPKIRS